MAEPAPAAAWRLFGGPQRGGFRGPWAAGHVHGWARRITLGYGSSGYSRRRILAAPTEWPGLPGTAGLRQCLRAGSLRPRCPTECAGTTPRGGGGATTAGSQAFPGAAHGQGRRDRSAAPSTTTATARGVGVGRAAQPGTAGLRRSGRSMGMHQQKALSVPQGGLGEHPASRCAPDLWGGGDGVEASRMRRGTPGRAGSGGGHSLQLELACRAATALTRTAMFHVKRHFTMAHLPGGHGRACSDGGCFT